MRGPPVNLLIEIECEDDGRWIAEVPDLPGVNGLRSSVFQFSSSVTLRRRFCSHLVRLLIGREETVQPSSVELIAYLLI